MKCKSTAPVLTLDLLKITRRRAPANASRVRSCPGQCHQCPNRKKKPD